MLNGLSLSAVLGQEGAVQHNPSVTLLQRLTDLLVILLAGLAANALLGFASQLPLVFAVLFAALFVILGDTTGLYQSWRVRPAGEEAGTLLLTAFSALILGGAMGGILSLLAEPLRAPLVKHGVPGTLLAVSVWASLVIFVLFVYRMALRVLLRTLRVAGFNRKSTLLLGPAEYCDWLEGRIETVPWYGLDVVGKDSESLLATPGGRSQIVERARSGDFDELYLIGNHQRRDVADLLAGLSDLPVTTYFVPDIFFNELMRPQMHSIAGVPTIGITTSPLLGSAGWIKRAEDLVLGSLILLVIAIPMLLIAAAIRLTSPGPVIFRQVRYGLNGKPITVFKFRTMTCCEDGDAVRQATQGDSRVTPVGAFLRRTSLDELPQFLNVLAGDMSIVGPRPHARAHNEYYRRLIPNYMLRHKVKPGITGWAQVHGWRGETDVLYKMQKRVEFDLDYIRNWSLWLDVRIVFMTVFHVFSTKEAY